MKYKVSLYLLAEKAEIYVFSWNKRKLQQYMSFSLSNDLVHRKSQRNVPWSCWMIFIEVYHFVQFHVMLTANISLHEILTSSAKLCRLAYCYCNNNCYFYHGHHHHHHQINRRFPNSISSVLFSNTKSLVGQLVYMKTFICVLRFLVYIPLAT